MSALWVAALASVRGPALDVTPIGRCAPDAAGWECWADDVQLVARVEPGGQEAVRARFAELSDWPSGTFAPVWIGDVPGFEAEVTDGTRTRIVRVWAEGDTVARVSLVGPTDAVRALAPAWLDGASLR